VPQCRRCHIAGSVLAYCRGIWDKGWKAITDRGPLIDYSIANDIQRIMALEYHIPVTPNGQIHLLSGDASGSGT
jgi:hypothetical protein